MNGADRMALDTHPYFAFDGANTDPVETYPPKPCDRWATRVNSTQQQFGILTAGEWSVAVNDCGLFVAGVGVTPAYGGDCTQWEMWENWDQPTKDALKQFALATMDTLQNWFFWTWKIGPSAVDNQVRSPFWSYKLGLENGWLPSDPREAQGVCAELGYPPTNPFDGQFQPWQTGGVGANEFAPEATATLTWPPVSLGPSYPVAAYLPTLTPTGTHTTLAVPRVTAADVDPGDGWFNDEDTAALMVPVEGCEYPDAYGGALLPQPTLPFCGGEAVVPAPTPFTITTFGDFGEPITTVTIVTDGVVPPNVLTTEELIEDTTTEEFVEETTTEELIARRFAPRAGIPLATMMP